MILALSVAVIASGFLTTLLVKLMDRRVDGARTGQIRAATNAAEVKTIRDVLEEVRAQDAAKGQRLNALEERLQVLEERERHQLVRAAVHEAWDRLSYTTLLTQNPQHPPPPPLTPPGEDYL